MADVTSGDGDSAEPALVLRYSHHVIEHLGLKLYQNRPTNVVAELVSNGWDAGASVVWINMQTAIGAGARRFLAVGDDGGGMTLRDLASSYLVIGKPKDRSTARKSPRYPMGRKGIGKLAPFGIARTVEVLTAARLGGDVRFNWLRIELSKILEVANETSPGTLAEYPPVPLLTNGTAEDVRRLPDPTGEVAKLLARIGEGTGTLVLMTNLSLLHQIAPDSLRQAMGRRFTVTLTRDDFAVEVNDLKVSESDSLPEFELRIPPVGVIEENVGGSVVRYWVGFVKVAAWPSDEAGVGVYAHGKIAQDRPFTFGVKGKEIFTRYMFASVEADYLDELDEDVISTDRRSIDWDHPRAATLYDWGQKKVRQWIEDYRVARRQIEKGLVGQHIDEQIASGRLPKIAADERAVISDLLSEVTPGLERDADAYDSVTAAVMKAYLHRPTHSRFGTKDTPTWRTLRDTIAETRTEGAITIGEAAKRGGFDAAGWHVVRQLGEANLRRLQAAEPGKSRRHIPKELRPSCHRGDDEGFTNTYGRMEWDRPSSTITAGCLSPSKGRFGHPDELRTLYFREASLLQTFPPGYKFVGDYIDKACSVIGNALPCLFAEQIGTQVIRTIERSAPWLPDRLLDRRKALCAS